MDTSRQQLVWHTNFVVVWLGRRECTSIGMALRKNYSNAIILNNTTEATDKAISRPHCKAIDFFLMQTTTQRETWDDALEKTIQPKLDRNKFVSSDR